MAVSAAAITSEQANTEDALLRRMGFRTRREALSHLIGYTPHPDSAIDTERVAAVQAIVYVGLVMAGLGWHRRRWTVNTPLSPCVIGSGDGKRFDSAYQWLDHRYRLDGPAGETIFVSEPYRIEGDDIRQLAALIASDWHVEVRPEMALHFPGRTLPIWIRRAQSDAENAAKGSAP